MICGMAKCPRSGWTGLVVKVALGFAFGADFGFGNYLRS